ncbi:MAG: hypothetical protein ACPH3D_03215, partial [Porticoccaceae bacterium]
TQHHCTEMAASLDCLKRYFHYCVVYLVISVWIREAQILWSSQINNRLVLSALLSTPLSTL